MTLAAIGTGIGSLFILFSGRVEAAPGELPPAQIAPAKAPAGQAIPQDIPQGALSEALQVFMDPAQSRTGGTTRSLFTEQTFDVALRNDSNRTLSFFVGLSIFDSELTLLFVTPTLGRKLVTLPPGARIVEQIVVPSLSSQILLPQTVSVEGQIFRAREDGSEVLRSDAIPIKFSFIG